MPLTASGGIITVIGDSQFWCQGLARDATWPYKLAQLLGGGTPTLDTLSPWYGWVESGVPTTGANRKHVAGGFEVRNAGVNGNATRDMRTRFATDVLGPVVKPDVCIIGGPVNDLYMTDAPNNDATYGLNYSPGGIKENVAWMVSQCVANGIIPILTTCQPWGGIDVYATRWQGTQDFLKWIGSAMTWMSSSETPNSLGLTLIDLYEAVYDPADTDDYLSGYSDDGNHPSAAATTVLAQLVKDALLPAPSITGSDVGGITATAATITANVNPNGTATSYRVEYGLTTSYGTNTSWEDAGSGDLPVAVEVPLTGLAPDTTYHARVVANNVDGTAYGADVEFTTDASPVPDPLTIDPGNGAWEQIDTDLIVRVVSGERTSTEATVYSPAGGYLRFFGADADLFELSADDETWAPVLQVPAGTSAVYLSVSPVAPDVTLTAQVGVPV